MGYSKESLSSDLIETFLKWRHRSKVATVSMIVHAAVLKMK